MEYRMFDRRELSITQGSPLRFRVVVTLLLGTLLLGFLFTLLKLNLFLPILLSIVLMYVLEPAVTYLEWKGVSRTRSILLIYLCIIVVIVLSLRYLLPPLITEFFTFQQKFPEYSKAAAEMFYHYSEKAVERIPVLAAIDFSGTQQKINAKLRDFLIAIPFAMRSVISLLFLVPLITFFLLKDGRLIKRNLLNLVPNKYFELIHFLLYKINLQLAAFIRGRLVEAIIVGIVVSIGLVMVSPRYAILFGMLAGILNLIPFLGPVLGAIPPLVVASIEYQSVFHVLMVLLVIVVAQLIDNILVIPILIAKAANLHPLIVLFAVLIGYQIFDIPGMIIGVPAVSVLKLAVQETYKELRRGPSIPQNV
ncbi:MAG: AI-2E family transporter [Nitrospinota bacterium]|nr:MAG: AI-2E family transporter [Nitrospinota bacterium]